jgi:hypothetical protein
MVRGKFTTYLTARLGGARQQIRPPMNTDTEKGARFLPVTRKASPVLKTVQVG